MQRQPALRALRLAAALGLALGAAAGTAHAGTTVTAQTGMSYNVGVERVITATDKAMLIFEADGDLALYATGDLSQPIWSAGTAGANRMLSVDSDGDMYVMSNDDAGTVYWQRRTSNAQNTATIELDDDCDLVAKQGSTVLWSVAGTCPGDATDSVTNGWCADTSEELTLVESDWAKLRWQTSGKLSIQAKSSDDGEDLFAVYAGTGGKVCFEDDGRLRIYSSGGTNLWSVGTSGASSAYHLGFDGCSLKIEDFATGAASYTMANTCPQATESKTFTKSKGTSDVPVVENDDAELVFTTAGALTLRTRSGEVIWTTGDLSSASSFSFASDGNLYIKNAGGSSLWRTYYTSSSAQTLSLDGCKLSLLSSSGSTVFSHGSTDCNLAKRSFDNSVYRVEQMGSGNETILRTAESHLDITTSGQLCLYTATGGQLWCGTTSTGPMSILSLQSGGTISYVNGAAGYTNATGGGSTLELLDGCRLVVKNIGGGTQKTISSSCLVGNYAYVDSDGNDTFGSTFSAGSTAQTIGANKKTESTVSLKVTVFGLSDTIYQADGWQMADGNGSLSNSGTVVIAGNTFTGTAKLEKDFFTETKDVFVCGVPVVITGAITGTLQLSVDTSISGQIKITPSISLAAVLSVGVGVGGEGFDISVGIKGELTFLEVGLPITMKVYSSGGWKFKVDCSLTIETLSGSLSLYAEAKVSVGGVKVGLEASYKLFAWTGLKWTKSLFSWDKSF